MKKGSTQRPARLSAPRLKTRGRGRLILARPKGHRRGGPAEKALYIGPRGTIEIRQG